ncbi:MAG: J domain-containing protein [Euryarchaeota archaeon]|nr:J domain-containing protein [Euryarchaeota archaeon]
MPEVASPDYYGILGVEHDATSEEIHEAFRHRAHECHPDLHPGDDSAAERFKAVNEAYHTLSNEDERRAYDASLTTKDAGHADLETTVVLGLRELFTGCRVRLRVPRAAPCPACGGEGVASRRGAVGCTSCGGSGFGPEEVFLGVRTRESCLRCGGRGLLETGFAPSPCLPCRGLGYLLLASWTEVRLPPGLEDGQRLCVPGQGQPLLQGGQGDLFLRISLRRGTWARRGSDLVLDLPVPSRSLSHGTHLSYQTPLETIEVAVPKGARYGQHVRYLGRGLPPPEGGTRGTLWFRLVPPSAGR